ncbi:hypothetical protein BDR04DRAFT_1111133 [Suillus decipiens]|nr:hypothetical protein BDR04DRAFT_1111133 [Suillus decipiens]
MDNKSCSVHVSRGDLGPWSIADLRSIARATITFSSVSIRLYPTRSSSKYCQPNSKVSGAMAQHYITNNYQKALEQVDGLELNELIKYISPVRHTLVNFQSLLTDHNTIESRLFPSPGDLCGHPRIHFVFISFPFGCFTGQYGLLYQSDCKFTICYSGRPPTIPRSASW